MVKQNDSFTYAFILVGFFMLLLVMAMMLITPMLIYFVFSNTKVFGDYGTMLSGLGSVIGCVLSFFSICLVLCTIRLQKKEMQEQRKQFIMENRQNKLMELQHMLIDSVTNLHIKRVFISNYCDYQTKELYKNECFEFFNKEVKDLDDLIKRNKYQEFSEKNLFGDINDMCHDFSRKLETAQYEEDNEQSNNNWQNTIKEENDKYSLAYYGIDKKKYQELSNLEECKLKEEITLIIEKKYRYKFAIYLRCLIVICKLLTKIKKEKFNNDFYKECRIMIVSQFSMEEEKFVRNVALIYKDIDVLLNVKDKN